MNRTGTPFPNLVRLLYFLLSNTCLLVAVISGVLHLRHNAALRLYEHCHLLNKLISRKFVPLTQKIVDNLNRMNGNVEEQRRTEG